MAKKKNIDKTVEHLKHEDATRKNIPTAEFRSVISDEIQKPIEIAYQRRNPDLDPQLVWRGKEQQNWSDLVVYAPPLYIQEKIHPKVLIEDLKKRSEEAKKSTDNQLVLFADFNGIADPKTETEFYQHDKNWTNRMILGDSLQVMASLAEREGLKGKVQCIYIDPPYGIKFTSNFQWSTTSRDVKDGKADHITREPEQVKAFRDTWKDGIHSYLSYLRDRLMVARDLLHETGSLFIQIGDENIHRVRLLLDEVFGDANFISLINFRTAMTKPSKGLNNVFDYIVWYAKDKDRYKYRPLFIKKDDNNEPTTQQIEASTPQDIYSFKYQGIEYNPQNGWRCSKNGLMRLTLAARIHSGSNKKKSAKTLRYTRHHSDFPFLQYDNTWDQQLSEQTKIYVVQTSVKVIKSCILMTSDPGDLILDPTCGSGTTAYCSELLGRRWITIDTSRVALALARARLMGAKYPFYLLADSTEGQLKEAEITGKPSSSAATTGNIKHGFVNERVPHITLKSIANNIEIDVIWDKFQELMEPIRNQLNSNTGNKWEEWEIPREADKKWAEKAKELHAKWWAYRKKRQKEIDDSIQKNADQEFLYDRPYENKKKVRVAGPFTVESISPHRTLGFDENDELIDEVNESKGEYDQEQNFIKMILENLKVAGVQQADKNDKINFSSLSPWPGEMICAEGRYFEGDSETGIERRAAIFIGPEFGTVSRPDLVEAAREAADAGFDVLISCAFSYDAHSSEFSKLGRVPVLKARMNADLHMASEFKTTGKGNLFVVFGEPDIEIEELTDNNIKVHLRGVDVFHPNTGEVRSDDSDGIACWFIDTNYNQESFFVRHAYFLGASDPYKSLKTTLKAEIDKEAWETLYSNVSRPFEKPESGRIAVKVINHLGDEVMKVYKV